MASEEQLTLCAMTLRGAPFPARLRAAAAAGFGAIGLTLDQYRAARASGLDDQTMRAMLDDHGLHLAEVETPWDWAAPQTPGGEGDLLFHVLETFGCGQFNAVQFAPHPHGPLVERFAALCARADASDVRVALEFMPFSELRTLGDAWRLVREAAAPNAGLLLDSWHYLRSGGSPRDLAAVPPSRILSVQLNDAQPEPGDDLREEARHRRLPPGDGATALVRLLRRHRVTARMSVEIWSDELERLAPDTAARLAYDATARVLAAAGTPTTGEDPA